MWGTPLPITHIYWEKVCHNILKKINHFVWRHEVFSLNHFWTLTLVRQRLMKSLLSICLSVCPSVCTSLTFLKIGSLVYSHIVHDDSWPWHLVTDSQIFEKEIGRLNLGQMTKTSSKTRFFVIFSCLLH